MSILHLLAILRNPIVFVKAPVLSSNPCKPVQKEPKKERYANDQSPRLWSVESQATPADECIHEDHGGDRSSEATWAGSGEGCVCFLGLMIF